MKCVRCNTDFNYEKTEGLCPKCSAFNRKDGRYYSNGLNNQTSSKKYNPETGQFVNTDKSNDAKKNTRTNIHTNTLNQNIASDELVGRPNAEGYNKNQRRNRNANTPDPANRKKSSKTLRNIILAVVFLPMIFNIIIAIITFIFSFMQTISFGVNETFFNASEEVAIQKMIEETEAIENTLIPDEYKNYPVIQANVIDDMVVGVDRRADFEGTHYVLEIPEGAKIIDSYAFFGDMELLAVIMPDTIEHVSSYAFSECAYLEYVRLSENLVYVEDGGFNTNGYSYLEIGEIPDSLEYVGSFAFRDTLATILPPNIQVGREAFDYSSYFETEDANGFVTVGDTLVKYTGSEENVVIPDGIVNIDSYVFMDNLSIENVTIPNSVEYIENYVFGGALYLENVEFSDSLIFMGDMVFYNCLNLKSAILPEGLVYIGQEVFFGCDSLKELHIPSTLSYAYSSTFESNSWYEENNIAGSNFIVGQGILLDTNENALEEVMELPLGINKITKGSIFLLGFTKELIVPEGTEIIEYQAIEGIFHEDGLIIDIPDSVTTIEGELYDYWMLEGQTVTIRCNQDSYAYEYADIYGYDVIIKGTDI